METFVGVDIGTSAAKAVAIEPSGRTVAAGTAGYTNRRPRPGFSEQDPEDWVGAARTALRDAGGERAAGVAFAGQMHGLVLLDGRGRVLRPAILWNDGRAALQRTRIVDRVGRDRLFDLVSNLPLPGATAASLIWVRENEPSLWSKIRWVLLPKDYVRWRLAGGEPTTDVTDASGTLLFDVHRRRWSSDLLDMLEVPAEWLPEVHESSAVVGSVNGGAVVAAGAGDQAASALGVGLVPGGDIGISLGTSGVVTLVTRCPPPAEIEGSLQYLCACSGDLWQTMGVTLAAGGSLSWWRRCCGEADTELLLAEATRCAPGCDGLIFHPYLSGERVPFNDESIRGSFTGLSAHHDRGAMTRAVVEGVACSLAGALELLSPDHELLAARVSGGLARSALVREVIASVSGLPVRRMDVTDSTAYGAALLAAVATGSLADFSAAARLCSPTEETHPVDAERSTYRAVLRSYRDRALKVTASSSNAGEA